MPQSHLAVLRTPKENITLAEEGDSNWEQSLQRKLGRVLEEIKGYAPGEVCLDVALINSGEKITNSVSFSADFLNFLAKAKISLVISSYSSSDE